MHERQWNTRILETLGPYFIGKFHENYPGKHQYIWKCFHSQGNTENDPIGWRNDGCKGTVMLPRKYTNQEIKNRKQGVQHVKVCLSLDPDTEKNYLNRAEGEWKVAAPARLIMRSR